MLVDTPWNKIGTYKCGDHWKGAQPSLADCEFQCSIIYKTSYMTYVARADRNCGCMNDCNTVLGCGDCDSYHKSLGTQYLI